jgi:hypothetical protein
MGRAYRYHCERCGYKADVCGADVEASGFQMTTIHCKDCRCLYDVLSRIELDRPVADGTKDAHPEHHLRLAESKWRELEHKFSLTSGSLPRKKELHFKIKTASPFQNRLTQLCYQLVLECPIKITHRVRCWKEPGRCPRCRDYLERAALPFREWD